MPEEMNNKASVIETDNSDLEERERRIRLKRKVLEEIIHSEESYIAQLDMLLNYFVRPIKEKELLSRKSYSALFGDIEPIFTLNNALYRELLAQESVGSAFIRIAPYLKLYSTYAHDYELALNVLQDLRKTNKEFEAFISQTERLPEVCRKLEALLIVPIQRVPRYRLLLTELISHTDENDPEHGILNTALNQVELVARHINEQIRDQENMQRMIRIQKTLFHGKPKILTPGRRFVREGRLKKVSSDGDSTRERYFILFSDMLLYCKLRNSDLSQQGSLVCSCILPLRHCQAEAVMGDGLFKVTCKEETILLCSQTAEEGRQWVQDINRAVQQLEANFRTLRKESSARKPIRKQQLRRRHADSLTRIFHQRKNSEQKKLNTQNCDFDVQILRCRQEQSFNVNENSQTTENNRESRTIKLPKWPVACPGTPKLPYSPRKLLALKVLSPSSDVQQEPEQLFCSPPIQTGPVAGQGSFWESGPITLPSFDDNISPNTSVLTITESEDNPVDASEFHEIK